LSYSLAFKVEKGFVSLQSMSGQVPEGIFEISGHVDPSREDLGVYRREPDGGLLAPPDLTSPRPGR
jgi:hypothetical protein